MLKAVLLLSSALVVAGQASAADLPRRMALKAPVVAAVPYIWTGCYAGGHVGAGWDRTGISDIGGAQIAAIGQSVNINSSTGGLAGVQAGCDYQFANHWVIGLAGDFSWANIQGAANDPFFSGKNGLPTSLNERTDRLASVTGRLGYAWDHFLFYGKGGAAWAHDSYSVNNLANYNNTICPSSTGCNAVGSINRAGWTVGAGVEWAFAANWSALVEYDHYGFDGKSVALDDPIIHPGSPTFENIKQRIDVVRAGINYRFKPFGG